MFCSNCGTQVPEKKKFCNKCGAPMPAATSTSSIPVHPMSKNPFTPGSQPKPSLLDKFFDMHNPSMQQGKPASKQAYNIIWFALFMALHIYVVVSYLVGQGAEHMNTAPPIIMLPFISIIALFCMTAGIVVIRLQITPEKIKKFDSVQTAMQYVQTVGIIGMSMIESVCIFGLVLFFVGFSVYLFYAFYTVSVLGIVWSRISVEPAWRFIDSNPVWKLNRE